MADNLYLINGSTLTSIGNAIRSVKGTTAAIPVSNFASEISKFSSGSGSTTPTSPVYHTVTFKGFNNETLATYQVKHGESCIYTGRTPVDSTDSYYFCGWNKTTTSVVSDMIVNAQMMSRTTAENYFGYDSSGNIKSYSGGSFAVIPNDKIKNVRKILQGTFTSSLTQLTMGDDESIPENSTFSRCTNLQDVYYCSNKASWLKFIIACAGRNDAGNLDYLGNENLFFAPRIHTTDGCIINS